MKLDRELLIVEALARHAGEMALSLQHNLTVSYKPNDEGPVTNADIAIDRYICEKLAKEFPNDFIVSEESFIDSNKPIASNRTWFVDPIDGTSCYVDGDSGFVVMIGLAIDGKACLGVVFHPSSDRLWRATIANEKTKAEKIEKGIVTPLNIKPKLKPFSDLNLLVSRTYNSSRQKAMIKALEPKNISYQSSFGLKAMMILEQEADLFVAWSKRIKMWDTCAPLAIAKAAGAIMSFIDGQELGYYGFINHGKPIMMASFVFDKKLLILLDEIA